MDKTQIKNSLLLLLTAAIWGTAFVAQSTAMDSIEPFTFTCIRSVLGGLVLIPVILFMNRKEKKKLLNKTVIIGGILCGIFLCVASNLQQIGIVHTTVGKAGFITALYVVLVPIFGLFMHKPVRPVLWAAIILAVTGLYLLCIKDYFSINAGDLYVLACAVVFSFHILCIDHFSPKVNGVLMSCIQFFVCGILSGAVMLFTEKPSFPAIIDAGIPVMYAGILSSGVAYTLQIVGQKNLNPTIASLILCLESVIAMLAGWLILGQGMDTLKERLGCVIMFLAIILAQFSERKK